MTAEAKQSRVRLDVGGVQYSTTLPTLLRYPNSRLASMFSGETAVRPEADGTFFIDRNGTPFGHILTFLRDGFVPSQLSKLDRELLIHEAQVYNLEALVLRLHGKKPLAADPGSLRTLAAVAHAAPASPHLMAAVHDAEAIRLSLLAAQPAAVGDAKPGELQLGLSALRDMPANKAWLLQQAKLAQDAEVERARVQAAADAERARLQAAGEAERARLFTAAFAQLLDAVKRRTLKLAEVAQKEGKAVPAFWSEVRVNRYSLARYGYGELVEVLGKPPEAADYSLGSLLSAAAGAAKGRSLGPAAAPAPPSRAREFSVFAQEQSGGQLRLARLTDDELTVVIGPTAAAAPAPAPAAAALAAAPAASSASASAYAAVEHDARRLAPAAAAAAAAAPAAGSGPSPSAPPAGR